MVQEIDRRKQAEKEIEYLAQHDPLTNLPNRRQIHIDIEAILSRARRQNSTFAVLFLDLDSFKKINDELGHDAGDVFLTEMASRFRGNIRTSDLIARYGGDEFIIVLSDITESLELSHKLELLTQLASQSVFWQGHEMKGGVSIGVSIFPEHGTEGNELIQCADSAMYLAKQAGRNTARFYSQELNDALQRKLLLESHLRKAIEYNELELHYQPIIDTQTGAVTGAEALLRWSNSILGSVSPVEFIPIAESCGLIQKLGIWVLQQSIKVMQQYPQLRFAINVSTLQFNNDQLVQQISHYISSGEIQPRQLIVEITEGMLLENTDEVQQRLMAIKQLGVCLSIDDFGTGYSALGYLKRCPINKLKIDRSFITEVPTDAEDVALVKGIIAMAHALDMKVVAEGVETKEQWQFLKEQNCDAVQGFFFAKPLNEADFARYVQQHTAS